MMFVRWTDKGVKPSDPFEHNEPVVAEVSPLKFGYFASFWIRREKTVLCADLPKSVESGCRILVVNCDPCNWAHCRLLWINWFSVGTPCTARNPLPLSFRQPMERLN